MLSVKRLILVLPLLLLMMMLSARMVYAKPPPAVTDETAGTEAADCIEYAEYKECGVLPPALPDGGEPDVLAAGSDSGEQDVPQSGSDAGSENEEGMLNLYDDADRGTAEKPDAGAGADDRSAVNNDSEIKDGDDGDKGDGSGPGKTLRGGEKTGSLIVNCNVKGSLGDLSRRFRYILTLENLEPDKEYEVFNEHADLGSGFSGNGFESDSGGKALLQFCLGDEDCLIIRDLPSGTSFEVCEKANDHTPEYIVHEVKSIKRSGRGPSGADLRTGEVKMTYSGGNYTVDFNNSREPAPVTGLPEHGPDTATTQLITGFALITVLIIMCMKSRHLHIVIDMNTTDVLESSEQFKRSDIDGYKSRCDKYHCHKGRPDRCA